MSPQPSRSGIRAQCSNSPPPGPLARCRGLRFAPCLKWLRNDAAFSGVGSGRLPGAGGISAAGKS
eukprot:2747309-Alexandrium_andersonii.AAC.1